MRGAGTWTCVAREHVRAAIACLAIAVARIFDYKLRRHRLRAAATLIAITRQGTVRIRGALMGKAASGATYFRNASPRATLEGFRTSHQAAPLCRRALGHIRRTLPMLQARVALNLAHRCGERDRTTLIDAPHHQASAGRFVNPTAGARE